MPHNNTHTPDVSVVVLCYRAGARIRPFVANTINLLEKNNVFNYELVLVGNYGIGSVDETPSIVAEMASAHPNIRHVALEKRGMMGWDMKSGLAVARGSYVAVIDGDGQMPVEDLITVYRKIKSGDSDLVKTYRARRADTLWRRFVSVVYNIIFSALFPGTLSRDINAKPKIFKRSVLEQFSLCSDDWFIDAEIMIQARRLGLRIAEVPTYFRRLEGRKSFVKPAAIFEFIKNLLVYRVREFKHPKRNI